MRLVPITAMSEPALKGIAGHKRTARRPHRLRTPAIGVMRHRPWIFLAALAIFLDIVAHDDEVLTHDLAGRMSGAQSICTHGGCAVANRRNVSMQMPAPLLPDAPFELDFNNGRRQLAALANTRFLRCRSHGDFKRHAVEKHFTGMTLADFARDTEHGPDRKRIIGMLNAENVGRINFAAKRLFSRVL